MGKDKADSRWENGIFAGIRIESGELFVMTNEGVIKIRTFCRKPDDERWDIQELDLAVGVPWEPIPGRGQIQVKSKVKFMEESGEKILEQFEEKKNHKHYAKKTKVL